MALAAQKKWPEAIAAFRAAVEKDPEMSEAWFQIGYAENEKNGGRGKATEASHAPLAHCLKLDPKHAKAHYYLGRVLELVRARGCHGTRRGVGSRESYRGRDVSKCLNV